MAWQEFTMITTDPEYNEVMVHIDVDTGKVTDLYCYADGIPSIVNYETDKEYIIRTEAGKNPLFVHIKNRVRILKLMLKHGGYIFCMPDDEKECIADTLVIEKMLKRYDMSGLTVTF